MDTARIANLIGRRKIADELGVSYSAVSNHVVEGVFPASWYKVIKHLAAENHVSVEESLFKFKDVRDVSREVEA